MNTENVNNLDAWASLLMLQKYVESPAFKKKLKLVRKAYDLSYWLMAREYGYSDNMTSKEKSDHMKHIAKDFIEAASFFEKLRIYIAE